MGSLVFRCVNETGLIWRSHGLHNSVTQNVWRRTETVTKNMVEYTQCHDSESWAEIADIVIEILQMSVAKDES